MRLPVWVSLAMLPLHAIGLQGNTSYTNPILPGWHSDPSCTFVPEWNDTVFCTTSTFMAFPANPVYASKDFVNWRLASNAVNRVSQFPVIRSGTQGNGGGMFANTLRYHNGTFYLISTWASAELGGPRFVMFTATDPYDDLAWSNVIWLQTPGYTIDPDIFFDDDGSVVVASAGEPIIAAYLDLATGNTSEPWELWAGTGGQSAEGPHIYKRDGYYYLLIAEGGTQLNHSATMARSQSLKGPWEAAPHNPLVSNRGTDNYFQTVGHADIFQDAQGNWWGVALSTRGGPTLYKELNYPMGRETVLFPVSWPSGGWPVADQVQGQMSGPLPSQSLISQGIGPVVGEPDVVDFVAGSEFPSNWVSWRAPFDAASFAISPADHENTLRLTASRANLTTDLNFDTSTEGVTALFRRQEHTYFNFSVDIQLGFGKSASDEMGISNFGTPDQHADLGIVYLEDVSGSAGKLKPYLRVRARSVNAFTAPDPTTTPVPEDWLGDAIRLRISPRNESHYEFFASSVGQNGKEEAVGLYSTALLSGDGAGTGGVLGIYATTNGGSYPFEGYVSRWRYQPAAQQIGYNSTIFVPT
ncbi:hypothetical protein N0V92_002592 [Colletotrichum tropicale]|nr:hypothetical protein N0V92_002592 [Colletotrichum tropicale]